jgi:hypothetical protein
LSPLRRFGRFWWDFVVGDDWRVAVGIVAGLAVSAAVAASDVPAWWILPAAVAAVLYFSVRREVR